MNFFTTPVHYLQNQHKEDDYEQKNSSLSSPFDQPSIHKEEHGRRKDSSSSSLSDHFSLAEIKLATNDFDDAFVIGKGGFGNVYKGRIEFGEGLIDVAIKRLNFADSNQGAAEFRAEVDMLSKFRHCHIVSLLGYHEGSDKREMILVYQYMPNGSLEDHLHKRRAHESNYSLLTWLQRLRICIGAARGLDYLHTGTGVESRVIHRDVKSSNILLDENLAAKISDFGLSRIGPANLSGTTNVYTDQIRGTFGYMDAEYFSTHRLTRKSDVYAFGVVLLEVLCGRPALDFTLDEDQYSLSVWAKDCIKEGNIDRIIDPSLRGQTRAKILKEFGRIAYECVLDRSKDRPTMTKVVARLELLLASTLQSGENIGRSVFIEKAWSLFFIKPPKGGMSSTKKLGEINNNKNATTVVDGGGLATASRQLVLPTVQTKIPILKTFTFSELRKATGNFSKGVLIGEGGFGKVYKGWLDSVTLVPGKAGDGLAVAIKRLNREGPQGHLEWKSEVNLLGTLSHPNIVKLFGYCLENEECILVYEYLQKGSLDMHLYRSRKGAEALPWETRIKIAMGAAQGLAFLHSTENNVILGDVKSSHILLDGDFNAKLSDFGRLTNLMSGPPLMRDCVDDVAPWITTAYSYPTGYASPEYMGTATGRLDVKSDVYGFGVLMMEMVTGLCVVDRNRPPMQHNLLEWGKPFLLGFKSLRKIMDPRLKRVYPPKAAKKVAQLILICIERHPKCCPSMEEVVTRLEEIKEIKIEPQNQGT